MTSNKDLERRIAVLEEKLKAIPQMLDVMAEAREAQGKVVEEIKKMVENLRDPPGQGESLPYISFEWNPALKLWRVQLNNVDDFLKEILKGDVGVIHDHPAQAFEMLLQKLQRKVS